MLHIRPEIKGILPSDKVKLSFQNETLRPILKALNDHLLILVREYFGSVHFDLERVEDSKLKQQIDTLLLKEFSIKFSVLGMVMGQMSHKEYATYFENSKSYNKRIWSMAAKRIFDGLKATSKEETN